MNYTMITTNEALDAVCQTARKVKALALDTEFVRTRTWYPQLGLIQLYDGENIALIDPLPITDWAPFRALLLDEQITKFLHASSEDLDVFLHRFGVLPTPMIDTQILAAFAGRALSIGFAALVASFTGLTLDKSESRTDWLARPLTARQCDYAAADVYYLLPVAHQLVAELNEKGLFTSALSECALLCQRRSTVVDPAHAWLDISNAWQLRPRQLAALRLLAAWRLRVAREKDMAINFVVREEHLWQVARYLPGSLAELGNLGLSGQEIRLHGKTLTDLVAQARALDESALPLPLRNLIDHPGYKHAFKALKAAVATVSERSGISQELLASRRQINQLLNWHWRIRPGGDKPELLDGWRGALLHDEIKNILPQG